MAMKIIFDGSSFQRSFALQYLQEIFPAEKWSRKQIKRDFHIYIPLKITENEAYWISSWFNDTMWELSRGRQRTVREFLARTGMGPSIVGPGPKVGLSLVGLRAVRPFADLCPRSLDMGFFARD